MTYCRYGHEHPSDQQRQACEQFIDAYPEQYRDGVAWEIENFSGFGIRKTPSDVIDDPQGGAR